MDNAEVVTASFTTLGTPDMWINQQILIDMRRADLVVPLALPTDSAAFTKWHDTLASTSRRGPPTSSNRPDVGCRAIRRVSPKRRVTLP